MAREQLRSVVFATTLLFALPALADKVAVLPFTSPNNTSRPELEEARKWTRDAVAKRGHTYATPDEMVSAEAAVLDGVADTTQELVAAGKAANAPWTLVARVERLDHPPARLPDGSEEDGYTTYRFEIEVCLVESGRVESLSREILPDESVDEIAEMLAFLVRPEGIANAYLPWEDAAAKKPKPKPKPKAPPPPPPPPPPPAAPPVRHVYGEKNPFSFTAVAGIDTALLRPDQARGPAAGMPIGGAVGYAFPNDVPGLELRAQLTGHALGPGAIALGAGARYALAPFTGARVYLGPELLLGAHVALGGDKTTRFLTQGGLFVAIGIGDHVQLEIAGNLAAALGASTLVLGGGTGGVGVRF